MCLSCLDLQLCIAGREFLTPSGYCFAFEGSVIIYVLFPGKCILSSNQYDMAWVICSARSVSELCLVDKVSYRSRRSLEYVVVYTRLRSHEIQCRIVSQNIFIMVRRRKFVARAYRRRVAGGTSIMSVPMCLLYIPSRCPAPHNILVGMIRNRVAAIPSLPARLTPELRTR